MARELDLFSNLAQELATALVDQEIDYVVGDAIEGYNPAHDLCRLIINSAIEMASRRQGRVIANFDVLLTSEPGDYDAETLAEAVWLDLDGDDLMRKLEVARGYSELAAEVDALLKKTGIGGFKTECLRRASRDFVGNDPVDTPYYEIYGERQVAAGHYKHVLRYREHILPLALALWDYAQPVGQKVA